MQGNSDKESSSLYTSTHRQLVLVRADGSAAWEEGPFRELVVEEGPADQPLTVSINFNNTYIDNVTAYVADQLQALDVQQ